MVLKEAATKRQLSEQEKSLLAHEKELCIRDRAYKIRFPNGTVDVFRGWVSSIGKAVTRCV